MDFVNENMHSDLVIEYAERFYNSSEHDGQQLPGVEIEETVDPDYRIKVTDVKIVDAEGEKVIGKPMGRYITVEAVHLPDGKMMTINRLLQGIMPSFCRSRRI